MVYGALRNFGLGTGLCGVDMAHGIACSTICSLILLKKNVKTLLSVPKEDYISAEI